MQCEYLYPDTFQNVSFFCLENKQHGGETELFLSVKCEIVLFLDATRQNTELS